MTLQAHRLAYARSSSPLFSNINFTLELGEALWLKGRNGIGKTTLLRLLIGLVSPISGEVRWKGQSIINQREDYYRHLIYCGHARSIKDDLTIWENVLFSAHILGNTCNREDAYSALAQVGLLDVAHLALRSLSQGQQKRVALAKLFLKSAPLIFILDEPSVGLDKEMVDILQKRINLHLSNGGLLIYTTHQPIDIIAQRIQILDLDTKQ